MEPTPKALKVTTLTGLVDYIKTNVDKHELPNLLCHVESPSLVSVVSPLTTEFCQRKYYIRAELEQLKLKLNTFLPGEASNILLQSCFLESEHPVKGIDRWLVLAYSANVTESMEGKTLDDGITQQVTVRKGIANKSVETLPNPVTLRPYRTFVEVEQPASKFVFRAQEGPHFALIEADGGAWKGEAMRNVKAWLETSVGGLNFIA